MNKKSFLFLYETKWNSPNGDPLTNAPRMDDTMTKAQVSDFRIKRYVRDGFITMFSGKEDVYYEYDEIELRKYMKKVNDEETSGSALRFKKYCEDNNINETNMCPKDILKKFVDVRLFGGILTRKGNPISIEGSTQFKNMSTSLNEVTQIYIGNTTVFPSKNENNQGSCGNTTLIEYAIFAVEGWFNEINGAKNLTTQEDIDKMMSTLWYETKNKNTRSKSGQAPIVLFEIEYKPYEYKYNKDINVYKTIKDLESKITITCDPDVEKPKSRDEFELNLNDFICSCQKDNVETVFFYTEDEELLERLTKQDKFKYKELF